MQRYEYKVIPAPDRGQKAKGVKTLQDRFALAVETAMNELGRDGWEYWRAESLPASERRGLQAAKIVERHMLVFRRPLPELAMTPADITPQPEAEETPQEPVKPRRMPVFTRRLEMAREQRDATLHDTDPAPETPAQEPRLSRPVDPDQGS